MSPVAKNKKIDSKTETENTNVDFNMLNYQKKIINTCNSGDESEWESDFSIDISDYDSLGTDVSP